MPQEGRHLKAMPSMAPGVPDLSHIYVRIRRMSEFGGCRRFVKSSKKSLVDVYEPPIELGRCRTETMRSRVYIEEWVHPLFSRRCPDSSPHPLFNSPFGPCPMLMLASYLPTHSSTSRQPHRVMDMTPGKHGVAILGNWKGHARCFLPTNGIQELECGEH